MHLQTGALAETDLARRLWLRVRRRGTDQCWPARGATTTKGYIQLWLGKGVPRTHVHRVAYMIANGAIPDGLTVDHLCRNKR